MRECECLLNFQGSHTTNGASLSDDVAGIPSKTRSHPIGSSILIAQFIICPFVTGEP